MEDLRSQVERKLAQLGAFGPQQMRTTGRKAGGTAPDGNRTQLWGSVSQECSRTGGKQDGGERRLCQREVEVDYRNTELQCVLLPSPLWRLQCAAASRARGGTGLFSVFLPTLRGFRLPEGSSRCVLLGLDVKPEEARVFMCHRDVYSEGGVPWYRLWSGQAVEIQRRQSLSAVLRIWNKFSCTRYVFHPRGFYADVWNAVRYSLTVGSKWLRCSNSGRREMKSVDTFLSWYFSYCPRWFVSCILDLIVTFFHMQVYGFHQNVCVYISRSYVNILKGM